MLLPSPPAPTFPLLPFPIFFPLSSPFLLSQLLCYLMDRAFTLVH